MSFLTPNQAEKFLPKAYNSFAKEFSSTRHYQWKEFERLSKTVPEKGNILDLGCGNGRLYKFLQEKKFRGEYFGADISEKLLQEAQKNNPEISENFIEAGFLDFPQCLDSARQPVKKIKFSQIWAVASFHHLSKISERNITLQNIYNSLTHDGEFICTVWNLWEQKKYEPQKNKAYWRAFFNPLWNKRDFIIPWGKQKTNRYYYSFDKIELKILLKENGFEISDIFYSEGKKNICVRAKKISDKNNIEKFYVHSLPFHKISISETIKKIENWAKKTDNNNNNNNPSFQNLLKRSGKYLESKNNENSIKTIFTPNPEMIMECRTNKKFESILQNADISLADGNGILWASGLETLQWKGAFWKWSIGIYKLFHYAFFRKSYNKKIEKPLCGSDLFREYLETAEEKKQIFLLGGMAESAKFISEKYSKKIAEYFDGMVNEENRENILEKIKESNATVLFVALGAPKQELWISENKQWLEENSDIKVALGVGGSFDFISGHQKRSPKIFQSLGLEWMYRLWKQPERAGRIWTATGGFIREVLR